MLLLDKNKSVDRFSLDFNALDFNRWEVGNKMGSKRGTRSFNTTGICSPEKHYMVNLDHRLAEVKILVDDGKYFTINRTRQFGKTTTLQALGDYLNKDIHIWCPDYARSLGNNIGKNPEKMHGHMRECWMLSDRW